MATEHQAGRTEGDINLSDLRTAWQDKFLSEKARALLQRDSDVFLHQALSTPCINMVERVDGIHIYDCDGRRYMDFHGNSVHQLGYNHPHLLQAMQRQLEALSFSPRRYANDTATRLAKKLVDLMPGPYRVLFAPGGAEAISIALKVVRKATGKHKVISLWDSFHGATLDTISVGGEGHFRAGIGPLLPGCEHVMPFNSYRGIFSEYPDNAEKCAEYIEYVCKCEGDIGAILMEPVRSTDVQVPPPVYYQMIRDICDRYGVALIFDEIPTAFGRTGKMFAFENYAVEPDILVIGKGLGGSLYPIGAVLAKEKYNVCQEISLGHYTHEKSPLGCAVGYALIEYIEQNDVLGHVAKLNRLLEERLARLKQEFEGVGDTRLIGALCGIELVTNRKTKEKDIAGAEKVLYACLENGLSYKVSQGNVLTLSPPLIIKEDELNTAMDIVEKSMEQNIR